MIYSFNDTVARDHGVPAAVFIHLVRDMILAKRAEGKNQRDGVTWVRFNEGRIVSALDFFHAQHIKQMLRYVKDQNILQSRFHSGNLFWSFVEESFWCDPDDLAGADRPGNLSRTRARLGVNTTSKGDDNNDPKNVDGSTQGSAEQPRARIHRLNNFQKPSSSSSTHVGGLVKERLQETIDPSPPEPYQAPDLWFLDDRHRAYIDDVHLWLKAYPEPRRIPELFKAVTDQLNGRILPSHEALRKRYNDHGHIRLACGIILMAIQGGSFRLGYLEKVLKSFKRAGTRHKPTGPRSTVVPYDKPTASLDAVEAICEAHGLPTRALQRSAADQYKHGKTDTNQQQEETGS